MSEEPPHPRLVPVLPPARQAAFALGTALLYFLLAAASSLLIVEPQGIAPIWPPSGLLLAALLLSRRPMWPTTLAAVFVAVLLTNLTAGSALVPSAGFALANCVESGVGAALLVRYVGLPITLHRLREVLGLVGLAALGSTALAGLLGAAVASLSFGAPFWSTWLTWLIADGLGILVVGSTILTWAAEGQAQSAGPGSTLELIVATAGMATAAGLIFGSPAIAFSYPFPVLPFLLWAAVRFGPRYTAMNVLLLSVIALWGTIEGHGPFSGDEYPLARNILAAQLFLAIATLSGLVLAAIVAELRGARAALQQASDDLQRAYGELERRVVERSAALMAANRQLSQQIVERERAETFLGAVLQQLPSGVTIAEAPSGRLIMYNEEASRLLEHPLIESADYTEYTRYGARHRDGRPYEPEEYPITRALLGGEFVQQEEMGYQRGDGTTTILSVNAAPIRDAEGRVIAAVSTFHDISRLKQMEATLATSQAQLSSIIESAMDAIIAVDEDQRIVIWNAAAERMFGCGAAEAHGQRLDRFIPERYRDAHREHIRAFGRTGTTARAMGALRPLAALRADGEEFPIEASISQVALEGRRLYTVILRDITERVLAEAALRRSEERFSKAFQTNPVAMVISTVDEGRILDVNDSFLQLFAYKRESVIGPSSILLDLWANPDDRTRAIAELRRNRAVRDFEVSVRGADGALRNVLLSADILQLSGQPCLITTLYDISERKQAEDALRESRQQLQAILDYAPALISLKRPDGHYILVNRSFVSLTQREPAEIIGRTDAELFPAEVATSFYASDRAVLESDRPLEVEEIVLHDDGAHTYSSVKFPLRDLSGASYALCTIATDITERKQLQAQLFQAQKMDSIGQLAGGIAHDFNNLLTAIKGYAELARESLPPHSHVADDLREIQRATERATTLTRQLLAFARRQPIEPSVVNLNLLLGDLDKLLRRLISEDINLAIRLAPELRHVRADSGQIEQVVINLVVNACDAMPDGGDLTIETANVTLDPRYAHGHLDIPAGDYVMLAVTDTGTGMAPEVQTHVFEPFFTTKQPGKGTGLGLSTCYGIVKQHGGTIWIYSELDHGTSVKVYLPQTSEEPTDEPDDRPEDIMPRGTETVLLVEDEDGVRALVARILRSCGYTVLEAANGVEAVRAARSHLPGTIDLMLTDVVMPHMGGQAASEEVTSFYPDVKVLFMSGYTEHATIQHRLGAGSLFLPKPFTPAILAQAVRAALDAP